MAAKTGSPRFVADRYRRIWSMVEDIAATPGQTRRELADRYHLSERQIQADLNIVRRDMGLPLIRRQGYRFSDEGAPVADGAITMQDAQALVAALRVALASPGIPKARLHAVMRKLPSVCPPHVGPLLALLIDTLATRPGRDAHLFSALTEAVLRRQAVRLSYPKHEIFEGHYTGDPDRVIRPELLLPYLGDWFVMGEVAGEGSSRVRSVMLPIADVTGVALVGAP